MATSTADALAMRVRELEQEKALAAVRAELQAEKTARLMEKQEAAMAKLSADFQAEREERRASSKMIEDLVAQVNGLSRQLNESLRSRGHGW